MVSVAAFRIASTKLVQKKVRLTLGTGPRRPRSHEGIDCHRISVIRLELERNTLLGVSAVVGEL